MPVVITRKNYTLSMDYFEYKELCSKIGSPIGDAFFEYYFSGGYEPLRSTRIKPLHQNKISIVRAPIIDRVFVLICDDCEKVLGEDTIKSGKDSETFLHALYDQHCDWHGVDDEGVES